jgi:L-amino acid N-acyltransferase YncA
LSKPLKARSAREIIEKRQPVNIIYRKATAEDIPQVAKVHLESWRKSFQEIVPQEFLENSSVEKREQSFREGFFKEDYQMFVAETAEGEIVGFADFGQPSREITGFDS